MSIRAVVVDIDGTMTDYERRLDWAGTKAVRTAEARGIPVVCASGNVAPVTKAFANFVGTTGPIVAENGGVIFDGNFQRRKVLASRARPDRAVRQLIHRGFPVRSLWSDPWRVSEVALQLNLNEAQVRKALEGWNLDVVTTRFALHIAEPGLDKLKGLRAALPYLRLKPRVRLSEILAVGDSNNDVGLLGGCGYSGVVANANEPAKAAAQYVARRKHGAGVKEILEHFRVI